LPGLKDGDFDHFAADIDGHRLFLTARRTTSSRSWTQKPSTSPHNARDKAPHAISSAKIWKKLFVVEGDASAVKIYDSETYKPLGEAKVSIDADSIAYDAATSNLYVVNGGREAHTPYSLISVIDTNNAKKLRDNQDSFGARGSDHAREIRLAHVYQHHRPERRGSHGPQQNPSSARSGLARR